MRVPGSEFRSGRVVAANGKVVIIGYLDAGFNVVVEKYMTFVVSHKLVVTADVDAGCSQV